MKAFAKNYEGFIKDLTRQLASQLQIENSALSLEQLKPAAAENGVDFVASF